MPEWHSIQFVWPRLLWLQLLLPLGLGLYIALQRPRLQRTWPTPQVTAALSTGRLAQHGPVWLVLAGMSMLLLAIARPQTLILLPSRIDTVMLVIDSSGSMRAADVTPSRIEAAQSAAKAWRWAKRVRSNWAWSAWQVRQPWCKRPQTSATGCCKRLMA